MVVAGYLVWAGYLAPQRTQASADPQAGAPLEAPAPEGGEFYIRDYQDFSRGAMPSGESMPLGRVVLDLAWKLALVLGLIYGAAWGFRRFRPKGSPVNGGASRSLAILEKLTLSPHRTLYLIEAEGQRLLLGSTEGQLRLLARLRAGAMPAPKEAPSFQSVLRGIEEGRPEVQFPVGVHPALESALESLKASAALLEEVGREAMGEAPCPA